MQYKLNQLMLTMQMQKHYLRSSREWVLKKADAIIEYRNQHGAFKSIEELANVKGISDKTISNNRDNIVLN